MDYNYYQDLYETLNPDWMQESDEEELNRIELEKERQEKKTA